MVVPRKLRVARRNATAPSPLADRRQPWNSRPWTGGHRLAAAQAREVELEARLAALEEQQAAFVSALSRELRAPLTAVQGLAFTLEREDLTLTAETSRQWAARITAQARSLSRLVDSLSTFDRLSRGGAQARRRPTNLRMVVEEALARCNLAGREVTVHVDPEAFTALVDPDETTVLVECLLDNAKRHTRSGTPVALRIHPEQGGVLIAVDDAGPGIPDADKQRIFEPFSHAHDATSPGLGLGLALVARAAALHGGQAWVADRLDRGSSFRVLLPAWSGAGPTKVLVVDWNSRCDWARSEALSAAGYEMSTCGGLEHVHAAHSCPLVEHGSCPLVTTANVFVFSLVRHTPAALEVLNEYRTRAPHIPMIVEVPELELDAFQTLLSDCVVVPAPLNAERLLDLLPGSLGA